MHADGNSARVADTAPGIGCRNSTDNSCGALSWLFGLAISLNAQTARRRGEEMATIPLAVVAVSIGASIYMAFFWRP
jgi:hypothetical protein